MRKRKIKTPGMPALTAGIILASVSVPAILISTDPALSRKVFILVVGAIFLLAVGIIQFLSYALRSEKGKQEYREKWAARALFHSLLMIAVSDNELNSEDVSYINNAYRKAFNKNLDDKEISTIARQIHSDPKVFLKDIKLYSNRIELLMREHIISSCIRLAAKKNNIDHANRVIAKLAKSLRIKSELLDTELTKQKNKNDHY